MALLGIRTPHDVARLLHSMAVSGEKESSGHSHITMLYVGDDVPIENIAKIVTTTFNVAQRTRPFTVRTDTVTSFPPHPKHGTVPIICRIESPELHALVGALKAAFTAEGVFFDNKFPEYRPHVTISYLDGPPAPSDAKIPVVEWGVGEIVLWGGDTGDERFVATFPLNLNPGIRTASLRTTMTETLYRAFVRIAMHKTAERDSWPV